ncbi:type VI secretion system tube protein IglC [Francisella philomiragia]|uniref:type VI secretion system tube protein IglC n=1 Tax=Francisella philomiragia TaxID=28110 RepID=UPI003510D73A
MSVKCQIDRSVVLDMKPLAFRTKPGAYAGTSVETRVWVDKLKIFGFECTQAFYATEGGTEAAKIKDDGVTASGIVVDFSLAGPQLSASVDLTLGVALTNNKFDELQNCIKEAKSGTSTDPYIEFGTSNKLQELKESDDKNEWGLMCDVSDLIFTPIEPAEFQVEFTNLGIQGGLSVRADYYLIHFSGLMLDAKTCKVQEIEVGHGDPSAKGIYPILGIDKKVAE